MQNQPRLSYTRSRLFQVRNREDDSKWHKGPFAFDDTCHLGVPTIFFLTRKKLGQSQKNHLQLTNKIKKNNYINFCMMPKCLEDENPDEVPIVL